MGKIFKTVMGGEPAQFKERNLGKTSIRPEVREGYARKKGKEKRGGGAVKKHPKTKSTPLGKNGKRGEGERGRTNLHA